MKQQQFPFYLLTQFGLSLFKFNNCFCHTVYEDTNVQVFYNETGQFVYNRSEGRVYGMSNDAWTSMVLKIERVINFPERVTMNMNNQ